MRRPLTDKKRDELERLKAQILGEPKADHRKTKEYILYHETPLTDGEMITLAQRLGIDAVRAVGVSLISSPAKGTKTRVGWYPGDLEVYSGADIKGRLRMLRGKLIGTNSKNFYGAALCLFGLTSSDLKAMEDEDTEFRDSMVEAFQYANYFEPLEISLGNYQRPLWAECPCARCSEGATWTH